MHFVEGRDAVVPFQQRGGVADAFDGARVKFPDRIDHRMIVGIENVFFDISNGRRYGFARRVRPERC